MRVITYTNVFSQEICSNGAVRITGGSTVTTGIVEVCINSTWGTICAVNWTNVNSAVICRQLGYQSGKTSV